MEKPATELDQHALWNGPAGQAWVDERDVLDRMFRPFEALLVDAARGRSAKAVLDIGCGTGQTTLALAEALGSGARCVGLDISETMLAVARTRAAQAALAAEFIAADAQRHPFADARFDLIVSRFGVMFFDDPVAAFTNLRRAMRADGSLCCIAWRGAAENPFMTTAERAAAPLLPDLPARRPGAPGQFAFADKAQVEGVLREAGWSRIALSPLDVACRFPASKLNAYLTRLGPLGTVLQQRDEAARRRIVETVRAAFDPFVQGGEVSFNAACWRIEAAA